MILGDVCTRSCRFCGVNTGTPLPADRREPFNVAEVVRQMQLKHCVITSVTRDDLEDGGAHIWKQTVIEIRNQNPGITIEALIPDFNGKTDNIIDLLYERPEIVAHNLETVSRLTGTIRVHARYNRSLDVIRLIAEFGLKAKSGLMVGLGETDDEVFKTIEDLRKNKCAILTIGQYLRPTKAHYPVQRYVNPEVFDEYRQFALNCGIGNVESSPLVRSSYHSELHL
jgi:lipoic acid synthetase